MTAIPATDSAICAVMPEIVLRTSRKRGVRADLEPARQDERRREDHEGDEPEPPVEDEEPDDGADERSEFDDERRQSLRQDVRDRVDVARSGAR